MSNSLPCSQYTQLPSGSIGKAQWHTELSPRNHHQEKWLWLTALKAASASQLAGRRNSNHLSNTTSWSKNQSFRTSLPVQWSRTDLESYSKFPLATYFTYGIVNFYVSLFCCMTQGTQSGTGCDRLKGGMGREMGGRSRREGTWVYLWLILIDVWQKTTKFCKAITPQLKKKKKKRIHLAMQGTWVRSLLGELRSHMPKSNWTHATTNEPVLYGPQAPTRESVCLNKRSHKPQLRPNTAKNKIKASSVSQQVPFSSVVQSCPTLCNPMNHSTPGLTVHYQLLEFIQTHVHWVGDAI